MAMDIARVERGPEDHELEIHTARWIAPIQGPLLEGAAIATFGGTIVEIGPLKDIRTKYLGRLKDHDQRLLMPGFVNAHCHLELSPLKWRLTPTGSFFQWVRALVKARDMIEPNEWGRAVEDAIDELLRGGVIALGDVGNTGLIPGLSGVNWPFWGTHFHEIIAPKGPLPRLPSMVEQALDQTNHFYTALSAHAPYSVSSENMVKIKQWTRKWDLPFSIHVAESPEEIQFLKEGKGPVKEILEERGHWPLENPLPSTTPVRYLDSLGILDSQTLCIHCLHVDEEEVEILARSRASVCFCPRSNVFLGVGKPNPIPLLEAGVNIALGTDSLASNDRLSMFAEMSSLASMCPDLDPEVILEAATLGGAKALGLDALFGALTKDRVSEILAVPVPALKRSEVFEYLVTAWSDTLPECYLIRDTELQGAIDLIPGGVNLS